MPQETIDADLASALADTQGVKAGQKVTPVSDDAGEEPAPEKTRQSTDRKDSELVATFRQAHKRISEGKDIEDVDEPDDEAEPPAKKPVASKDKSLDDQFPDIDTKGINVGSAVTQKFQAFKTQRKALLEHARAAEERAAAAEAKIAEITGQLEKNKSATEESEVFKSLKQEHEATLADLERVRLEESPRFQKEYDKPIHDAIREVAPILESFGDEANAIVAKLDALLGVKAGQENDRNFYKLMNTFMRDENIPDFAKAVLMNKLPEIRKHINRKQAALADWKATRDAQKNQDQSDRMNGGDASLVDYDAFLEHYEREEKARLEQLRAKPEIFEYDSIIEPAVKLARAELEKSIKTGRATKTLIGLLRDGAEYQFVNNQYEKLKNLTKEILKQREALQKKLDKITGADSSRGSRKGSTPGRTQEREAGDDDSPENFPKGSGILANMESLKAQGKI